MFLMIQPFVACSQIVRVLTASMSQSKARDTTCSISVMESREESTWRLQTTQRYYSNSVVSLDQPTHTDGKVHWKKVKQNGGLRYKRVFCSFLWLSHVNSRLTATAARINSLYSISERESVTMMMKWCLMSSDVSWHIRDKLWPMPKHGSINLYVHGNQKSR